MINQETLIQHRLDNSSQRNNASIAVGNIGAFANKIAPLTYFLPDTIATILQRSGCCLPKKGPGRYSFPRALERTQKLPIETTTTNKDRRAHNIEIFPSNLRR